jgi:hypothetical protein
MNALFKLLIDFSLKKEIFLLSFNLIFILQASIKAARSLVSFFPSHQRRVKDAIPSFLFSRKAPSPLIFLSPPWSV